MDPEVFLAAKVAGQGLEQGSDGVGEAASVFDDRGDLFRYHVKDFVHGPAVEDDGRVVGEDKAVEIGDGHEGVAEGAGDALVDLTDDD